MAYAAFVQVAVDPTSSIEHRHSVLNEFILPAMKKLDGFKSAIWLNDGQGVGTCIAQFDTREQAKRSLDVVAPGNGPRVIHAGTCEVELQV
jgi:hypothetical protein